MPFDGTTIDGAELLIGALRSEMPAGFGWDFGQAHRETDCGSVGCAIGLAHEMGLISTPTRFGMTELGFSMAETACLSADPEQCLAYYGVKPEFVTPGMVADRLAAIRRP